MLHEGGRLRSLRDLLGPVHDRGLGPARHDELRHDEADLRATTRRSQLILVRNPDYDQADATTSARTTRPVRLRDQLEQRGLLRQDQGSADRGQPLQRDGQGSIKEYTENPDLEGLLKANPDDGRLLPGTMNLRLPPFDDIHVRKAVNLVMDKNAMIQRPGVARRSVSRRRTSLPPTMSAVGARGLRPVRDHRLRGRRRGRQGGDEAVEVRHRTRTASATHSSATTSSTSRATPSATRVWCRSSRIDSPRSASRSRPAARRPVRVHLHARRSKVPFSGTAGWGKDYADAFTYFLYLFDGRAITPDFTYNEPLVGLTEDQAKEMGIDYPARRRPERRRRHRRVHRDRGRRPSGRHCWGDLDKKVMEEVVPWVPWIWRNYTNIDQRAR